MTLTLDLGTRELDATHLLMVLYNSVKFDSNPCIVNKLLSGRGGNTKLKSKHSIFEKGEIIQKPVKIEFWFLRATHHLLMGNISTK